VKADKEVLTPTRVKLTIQVPFDELKSDFQNAYKAIANQVTIPGFRKGKVPTAIIDQRVGRAAVLEEVVNSVLPRAYAEAVKEHDLDPFGPPEVNVSELKDNESITFTAELDIRPEFELPAFNSIEAVVDAIKTDDEFVTEQFDLLRRRFATMKVVERAAESGDLVILDAKGTVDGEESDDYSATALNYELGTGGLVPGADEALIGISVDETKDIEFVPADGPHQDKKVKVTFTCTGVRERELPEANDEFAQMASEFDTVAELKADLAERIRRVQVAEQAIAAREKVFEALLAAIDLEIPANVLKRELDSHFADGHGDDAHRDEFEADTIKNLKSSLVLDKIADQEKVQVNEVELSEWLVRSAPRYGVTPEELADELVKNDSLGIALNEVRRGKALTVVVSQASVKTPAGEVVDLSEFTNGVEQ
jgi:trigger factor